MDDFYGESDESWEPPDEYVYDGSLNAYDSSRAASDFKCDPRGIASGCVATQSFGLSQIAHPPAAHRTFPCGSTPNQNPMLESPATHAVSRTEKGRKRRQGMHGNQVRIPLLLSRFEILRYRFEAGS